ncbi:hypothetical protein HY486_02695 [Candidatus Woesearchaeota archaeon]|nr:hypothetical protein [Candidatus Woesearchaeota archaeon]
MRRKVTLHGPATLSVSLPLQWARKRGVKKGDELDVVEQKGGLVISANEPITPEKKMEIHVKDVDNFLKRMFFVPYAHGCTEIKVTFDDKKVINKVENVLEMMMGFEMTEQGKNYCIVKQVANANGEEFEPVLNRIFISNKAVMTELLELINSDDYEKLRALSLSELTNNRLVYFCLRLLTLQGYKDPYYTGCLYYVILTLEEIADDLRDICTWIADNKLKLHKSVAELLYRVTVFYDEIYKLHNSYNQERLVSLRKQIIDFYTDVKEQIRHGGKEAIVLGYIMKIADDISNISKELKYETSIK